MTLHAGAEDAVLRAVRELVVVEVNPTSSANVGLGSSLDRYSRVGQPCARVELLARLEDSLRVRLPSDLLVDAETPRDLVDGVLESAAASPAALRMDVEPPSRAVSELPLDVVTLVDALEWHASVHPDRVHVRLLSDDPLLSDAMLTYATLRDRARSIAAGLAASDVRPGDSVAIMLPTSIEYFAAFMGVLVVGGVPVPLYPPSRPAQLEDYLRRQTGILGNARATALVTTSRGRSVASLLRAPGRVAATRHHHGRSRTSEPSDVRPPVRPTDVAFLQYTSGSTGNPRASC